MREGREGCEGGGEGWCEGEEMGVGGETEGVKQGWEFALSLFGN